jgi:biopolymer transport protein ExbB
MWKSWYRLFPNQKNVYTRTLFYEKQQRVNFIFQTVEPVDADIVTVGNIAAFGIAKEAAGALAPAGEGKYKLWNSADACS